MCPSLRRHSSQRLGKRSSTVRTYHPGTPKKTTFQEAPYGEHLQHREASPASLSLLGPREVGKRHETRRKLGRVGDRSHLTICHRTSHPLRKPNHPQSHSCPRTRVQPPNAPGSKGHSSVPEGQEPAAEAPSGRRESMGPSPDVIKGNPEKHIK